MSFPNLNLLNPTYLSRTMLLPLVSNPAFVGSTNWTEFNRTIPLGPSTGMITVYWAADWDAGSVIDMAGDINLTNGAYLLGPNTTTLGVVAGPAGGAARRLQSSAVGNCYIASAMIPVKARQLYNLRLGLRRVSGPVTTGFAVSVDEYETFSAIEDSSLFSTKLVNPAIRKEMEGGFVSTRRRYTRSIYEITTGFTDISDANKRRFETYVGLMGGGSSSFPYINPVTGEQLTVRFRETPTFKYTGMGGVHRWSCSDIKLETV